MDDVRGRHHLRQCDTRYPDLDTSGGTIILIGRLGSGFPVLESDTVHGIAIPSVDVGSPPLHTQPKEMRYNGSHLDSYCLLTSCPRRAFRAISFHTERQCDMKTGLGKQNKRQTCDTRHRNSLLAAERFSVSEGFEVVSR